MKKLSLLLVLCLSFTGLFAQQYGHCNFGELLSLLPETEVAEKQLQEFNDKLVGQGEEKAKVLQAEYQAYEAARASGAESPLQLGEREKKITKMQQELSTFEQQAQGQLDNKRNELLKPVIDRANAAIETVSKANGFTLVFDTSVFNAVLFAEDSQDVMELVKTELGIE